MTNKERPVGAENDQVAGEERVENLLAGSESFAYFKKNGIKPPSENAWTKVLFDLGPEVVEKNRAILEASAERNLSKALKRFDPEAARQIAKIGDEEAEEKYKALIEESRNLPSQIEEIQAKLGKLRADHPKDLDLGIYIDEFEEKLATAKGREKELNDQMSLMEAVFYIPDEVQEERFRVPE